MHVLPLKKNPSIHDWHEVKDIHVVHESGHLEHTAVVPMLLLTKVPGGH